MRAVLDTNVVVSALAWGGAPSQLIAAAGSGNLVLFTSPTLLAELQGVIRRPHLVEHFGRRYRSVEDAFNGYMQLVTVVTPDHVPRLVPADADDDHVVAAAVTAEADLIVSGDKHLLQLGTAAGISVLAPAAALQALVLL